MELLVGPDHASRACRLDLLEAGRRRGIRPHQVEGEPAARRIGVGELGGGLADGDRQRPPADQPQADRLQVRDQDGVSQGLRKLLRQFRRRQPDDRPADRRAKTSVRCRWPRVPKRPSARARTPGARGPASRRRCPRSVPPKQPPRPGASRGSAVAGDGPAKRRSKVRPGCRRAGRSARSAPASWPGGRGPRHPRPASPQPRRCARRAAGRGCRVSAPAWPAWRNAVSCSSTTARPKLRPPLVTGCNSGPTAGARPRRPLWRLWSWAPAPAVFPRAPVVRAREPMAVLAHVLVFTDVLAWRSAGPARAAFAGAGGSSFRRPSIALSRSRIWRRVGLRLVGGGRCRSRSARPPPSFGLRRWTWGPVHALPGTAGCPYSGRLSAGRGGDHS